MEWINEFFKNPSWIGLITVGLVLGYFLIRDRNTKKAVQQEKEIEQKKVQEEKEVQQKNVEEAYERQEISYKTIDKMADELQRLNDNATNKVNLMVSENIITKTLLASKAILRTEIRRIFEHNHRENARRQAIIKQSIANVSLSIYEDDIKMLSALYYKNKQLSDFLINIDTELFFSKLLKLVFTFGGNLETELTDTMMFIDSQFNMFILKGKKYYNNL
ncbi:MAG: hypothetical protein U9Q83_03150 [Bacteroidota bacterium]|nr:hypothetical protein [Bacteroidota bacterium]